MDGGTANTATSARVGPPSVGPRAGALGLLTPAQRGLAIAIMQADRCGRGGDDLTVLSGNYQHDTDAAAQLNARIALLDQFQPNSVAGGDRR